MQPSAPQEFTSPVQDAQSLGRGHRQPHSAHGRVSPSTRRTHVNMEGTTSVGRMSVQRKRKALVPLNDVHDVHNTSGKAVIPTSYSSPRSVSEHWGATSSNPVGDATLPGSDSQRILPWRGDLWLVATASPSEQLGPVQTPIPVRFNAGVLVHQGASEASTSESQWIIGLVIHSYVRSDRSELMYVVLLDDGREVHLHCGDVDRIQLVRHWDSADPSVPGNEDDLHAREAQHPSSHDLEVDSLNSQNSFYSSLLRSCSLASDNVQEDVDITSTDRAFSLGGLGNDNATALGHDEGLHDLQATSPTFSNLFHEALQDSTQPVVLYPHGPPIATYDIGRMEIATEDFQIPTTTPGVRARQCQQPSFIQPRVRSNIETSNAQLGPQRRLRRPHTGSGGPDARWQKQSSERAQSTPPASRFTNGGTQAGAPNTTGEAPSYTDERSTARVRRSRGRQDGRLSAAAQRLAFLETFKDETWRPELPAFFEPRPPFIGPPAGPSFPILRMPTKAALFSRFWSERTLSRICVDTNRYASQVEEGCTVPLGGLSWWPLEKAELKAFFAVNLLMGIKHLPDHRSYWNRGNKFLYCPSISSIMSCKRYEDITRCLHVADDTVPTLGGQNFEFDKLCKMRWLISEMQHRFRSNWNLHQEITIDETMIGYKGKYCPVRQYMPRKPTKWGVKVWCLADARHKYLYDFEIYTGSLFRETLAGVTTGEAKTAHEVVLHLMEGLHGMAHVVCTDNYFTSVKLLMELRSRGTFAVGTVRCNRMGLPKALLDLKMLSKEPQGTLLWRMHSSGEICAVVFVDRKAFLMLSTYYPPIPAVGDSWPTVPRRIHGVVTDLATSPVHRAYSEYMRGVDVADHLRGNYSSQTRSHKWWHKVFFYLLDTSVVNCYILNKIILDQLGKETVTHLHFRMQLADELSRPWSVQRGAVSQFRLSVPGFHGLIRTAYRRKCRFCRGRVRTNLVCPQCGGVSLHAGDCFQRSHYAMRR